MDLTAILEAGRRDFLDAVGGIGAERVSVRPAPGCWSVLECIEHVVIVEDRYLGWISEGMSVVPRRDAAKEMRLFTIVRNRLTKVETPEVLLPAGRFLTLQMAVEAFQSVRDRSVEIARARSEDIYTIGATHPYFGKVNGAEMIQLIDGHARRHADQIREIGEAPAAMPLPTPSMKPVKNKKAAAFHRDRPDLPAHFEEIRDDEVLLKDGDSIAVEERRLADIDQSNLRVGSLRMEGSVLERVQLAGGQFGSIVWKDVRLVGCDLANVRAHRIALVRVELVDCRLTGFRAGAVDWQDVLIQNGDGRYAQLQSGKFRACEFDGCNLEEADLREADLSGSIFRGCNLARADLQRAKLQSTDFRKSELEGMLVGMNDLRGAIVDAAQAMVLARLMGLQIL